MTKKIRINIEVSPRVRRKLGELKELTGARSLTEVIRRSFALYDMVVSESRKGNVLILEHEDGRQERVVIDRFEEKEVTE